MSIVWSQLFIGRREALPNIFSRAQSPSYLTHYANIFFRESEFFTDNSVLEIIAGIQIMCQ